MPIADIRERLRSLRLNSGDTTDFAIKDQPPSKPVMEPPIVEETVRSAQAHDAKQLTPNETVLEKVVESPGASDSEGEEHQDPLEEGKEKRIAFDASTNGRGQEVEGRHGMTRGSPSPAESYQLLVEEEEEESDGAEANEPNKEEQSSAPIVPRKLTADRQVPRPQIRTDRPTVTLQQPSASPQGEFAARLPSTPHPSKQVLSRPGFPTDSDESDSDQYFDDKVDDRVATIDRSSPPFTYTPLGTLKVDEVTRQLSTSITSLMKSFNQIKDEAASHQRIVQLSVLLVMSLIIVGLMYVLQGLMWATRKGVDMYSAYAKKQRLIASSAERGPGVKHSDASTLNGDGSDMKKN